MATKPKRKGATRAEFAAHVSLTPQRVGQMIAEKTIPLHADGSIDLDGARLAYIDGLRSGLGRSDSAQRVQDMRAETLKFKLEQERGEWMRLEHVVEDIGLILGEFRAELAGLPAASSRDLDVRAAIELNLYGSLERLRSKFDTIARGGSPCDDGGDDVED
jgi:hypothetical protein